MNVDEMISVLRAYEEGKVIQFWSKQTKSGWQDCTNNDPSWNFAGYNYRVKPESHYRPFKDEKELSEAIKEHGFVLKELSMPGYCVIVAYDFQGIQLYDSYSSFVNAIQYFTFSDGTPFGVKI